MSDRKQALQDLLAKVEAGTGIEYSAYQKAFPHPAEFENEFGKTRDKARGAFIGSLDAAKALHDAVLPEWHFDVATEANGGGFYAAISPKAWGVSFIACSDSPARAWLCALLKALIAKADT